MGMDIEQIIDFIDVTYKFAVKVKNGQKDENNREQNNNLF